MRLAADFAETALDFCPARRLRQCVFDLTKKIFFACLPCPV
jgi:hypothetical protein